MLSTRLASLSRRKFAEPPIFRLLEHVIDLNLYNPCALSRDDILELSRAEIVFLTITDRNMAVPMSVQHRIQYYYELIRYWLNFLDRRDLLPASGYAASGLRFRSLYRGQETRQENDHFHRNRHRQYTAVQRGLREPRQGGPEVPRRSSSGTAPTDDKSGCAEAPQFHLLSGFRSPDRSMPVRSRKEKTIRLAPRCNGATAKHASCSKELSEALKELPRFQPGGTAADQKSEHEGPIPLPAISFPHGRPPGFG